MHTLLTPEQAKEQVKEGMRQMEEWAASQGLTMEDILQRTSEAHAGGAKGGPDDQPIDSV